LSAVDEISREFLSWDKRQSPEVRTDVFPDDFALWRHLEKPSIRAFVDQGIAVRQAPGAGNERAVEIPSRRIGIKRRILPYDLLGGGIDFQNARPLEYS